MAWDFSGQDALSAIGGGVMEEVLHKRRLREQARIVSQQQGFQQQQLATQQAGATERERIQAGSRVPPEPKRDPIADYEQKLLLEKKYGVGHFKPDKPKEPKGEKDEKQKYLDSKVSKKLQRWNNAEENARRGETDIMGNPRSHIANQEPIPTMEGQPVPYALREEVARTALELDRDDQSAADIVYARNAAEDAGEEYNLDPREMTFDAAKVKSLPSMAGRNLRVPNIGGKANLYMLATIMSVGGWTRQEFGELLDEYFGNVTTQKQEAIGGLMQGIDAAR